MNREDIKSSCCNADVEINGGGYDGEDIQPITQTCTKCLEPCDLKECKDKTNLPF